MVWYKQSIGQIPQPIALSYNYWDNIQFENEFNDGRFDISASEDSFHLSITATIKEDIGKYYCGIVFLNKIEFISGAHLLLKGKYIFNMLWSYKFPFVVNYFNYSCL